MESKESVTAPLTHLNIVLPPIGSPDVTSFMHSSFNMTNTTSALCTYITLNTITFGTGTTKPATAETTAQQINLETPPQSQVLKESDAFTKRDHQGLCWA